VPCAAHCVQTLARSHPQAIRAAVAAGEPAAG